MSTLIWQCVCDARIEGDIDDERAHGLIAQFIGLHVDCSRTWRARWYPERETAPLDSHIERRMGFEIPDSDPDDRARS
jgi:hypothetical protein